MIDLDHNATTRPDPKVVELMTRVLLEVPGNPSSVHRAGQAARALVDEAREQVAEALSARPRDVVFTSGGTEADNLALRGLYALRGPGKVVVSAVEHPAVRETARCLGAEVVELPVSSDGGLDLDFAERVIDRQTALVSVMWANNETGVVHPIEQLGFLCRQQGVPFHVDAVQAFGKLPIDVTTAPVDALSLSAHKLHGPKGAGALWLRTKLAPALTGGHQERGRRGGTENVAAIAGFGLAAQLATERLDEMQTRVRAMRDRLEAALTQLPGALVVGRDQPRVPNTVTVCFEGVEGEALLMALDLEGICASSGSACSSGSLEPSHVLRAMGVPDTHLKGALRLSLGVDNTEAEIATAAEVIPGVVARLR